MEAILDIKPLPPAEAIAFFESKGFKVGFDWRDVWQQEHARAFTVAKAMQLDVLQTIRQEVDAALRDGLTKKQFTDSLRPRLQTAGWWGRADLPDPLTGEIRNVQLGSPRRLGIIYDVNLRSARAAGRWARIERVKSDLPFLRYSAVLDDRTRPKHRSWHSIVLPVDHPFWETHYPPNGWRCRCIVQQFSQADLDRNGFEVSSEGEVEQFINDLKAFRNKRNGAVSQIPNGIDPGFGFNIGKAHMRGLTPPPQSGPLRVPAIVASSSPLPPVRLRPASRLLSNDRDALDENINAFLGEFGAVRGRPVVFTDKIGEPLVISEDLFLRPNGSLKLAAGMRRSALLLAADTIKDPDEIWWRWETIRLSRDDPTKVEQRLRRRYFARFEIEGKAAPLMSVFDVGKDGWRGVTTFRARNPDYLLRNRLGVLAYRRSDPEESPE